MVRRLSKKALSLVSIRAPREGGDVLNKLFDDHSILVSIRAPREGGDIWIWVWIRFTIRFNPRPPRRGR